MIVSRRLHGQCRISGFTAAMLLAIGWLASPMATRADVLPSHHHKPGARVEMMVEAVERAEPGGEFSVRAQVTPAISAEWLLLQWRASPGIELAGDTTVELSQVMAGMPVRLQVRGRWSGELPGRVYLAAEWRAEGERVPHSIAVSVIDAASEARLTRPPTPDGVRAELAEP